MTANTSSRRGQPLVVLGGLLLGWVALRVVLWQPPFELGDRRFIAEPPLFDRLNDVNASFAADPAEAAQESPDVPANYDLRPPTGPWRTVDQPLPGLIPAPLPEPVLFRASLNESSRSFLTPTPRPTPLAAGLHQPARMAVGHSVLAMMGLSRMEVPPAIAAYLGLVPQSQPNALQFAAPGIPQAAREPVLLASSDAGRPRARRWTGDAWLLLRDDSTAPLVAGQPSYGRSQAGAVLRYRLAPSSPRQPQAYVRASAALERPRDVEIAGGISARPLARVPVRLAAELRVADTAAGTNLRPAAFAVTEFPPLDLPFGARGEAYAQGGYVGGDFATPFIDGQLRVTRDVVRVGRSQLSAGAATWGGAQENASRLDVGPSAAISFRLGEVQSRLSVDYRVRVAGDAKPASGPALTLSAGF